MDDSVNLQAPDTYDRLETMTLAGAYVEDTADVTDVPPPTKPSGRSRRELERYLEERALEKELDDLW